MFCALFKTYSNCSDDRLSFSLSLRFNLNAQICNGYNGKRGFCWCKKREKRTTLLCEKETRLQLKSSSQNDFSLFLSLSLFLSSLFLSLCYCIRLNREHDVQWKLTPSTSASIRALLASSHRRRNNNGRRRRRNFDRDEDDDDDDDRVSRARRRGKTTRNFLSLFRIGKRSLSLSLARALF